MTDEEIAVEFEAVLCSTGETKKTCPKCNLDTFQKACPRCAGEQNQLTGDAVIDDVFARMAAGEEVDLDAALRGQVKNDTFVPVAPKG